MVKAFLKQPALVVHGRVQAEWALRAAAGRPLLLLSAPGAALNAGPGWFKTMIDQAADLFPDGEGGIGEWGASLVDHGLEPTRPGIQRGARGRKQQ